MTKLGRFLSRLGTAAKLRPYKTRRDWLWGQYQKILTRPAFRRFPGQGRVCSVELREMPEKLYLRLGRTDWVVLDELFARNEYTPVLREASPPVRWILDLGANVGLSIRLWQKHFPAARVIAVEPDAGNLAIARMNIEAGPAPDRITFVQGCAAGVARTVVLDRSGGDYALAMRNIPDDAPDQPGDPVAALTVDQILERAGDPAVIDLLKCDIEGAEAEVFADCRGWISRVRHIAVELHAPYSPDAFLNDLRSNGADFDLVTSRGKDGLHVLVLTNRNLVRSESSASGGVRCHAG